jgi:hypothetical protein
MPFAQLQTVLLHVRLYCYQWITCHLQGSAGIYQTDLGCNLLPHPICFWAGLYLYALSASDGVLLRWASRVTAECRTLLLSTFL